MQKQLAKRRSTPLKIPTCSIHVGEVHTSSNKEPYPRRTISIAPAIHQWIQNFRADYMKTNKDSEVDYTTLANHLMAWGIRYTANYQTTQEDSDFVDSLVGDRLELGQQGLIDALEDLNKNFAHGQNQEVKKSAKGKQESVSQESEQV